MQPLSRVERDKLNQRESNIELLRLIAMVMVLICHLDFHINGIPDLNDIVNNPVGNVARVVFSSLSKCCVIVFVFISGWFGIRFSIKTISGFLFQCLYFSLGAFLFLFIIGINDFPPMGLLRCFGFGDSCWFEKAYLALIILSPVLNIFADSVSRRQFRQTIVLILLFQTVYGLTGSTEYINQGYSVFTFCSIYLLARYLSIYHRDGVKRPAMIYFGCSVINVLIYVGLGYVNYQGLSRAMLIPS